MDVPASPDEITADTSLRRSAALAIRRLKPNFVDGNWSGKFSEESDDLVTIVKTGHTWSQIVRYLFILIVALRDHLGEEGDAGVELAVALVVWHELEHGDEVVGQDEWRNGLAVAAEAEDDGNCLVTIKRSGHTWSHR